jgi:TetR/AcrR family fatty acid metabolism transcriptional regulator
MEDSKRTIIIEAATRVFAEKGYQYATMSEIAKESGIATGLTYSYFKNKLDILFSIILAFWKEMNQLSKERLPPIRDPFDKLFVVLHNFEDLLVKDEHTLCRAQVLHEALPHFVMIKEKDLQEKRQQILASNREFLILVDSIIADGQEQGVFDNTMSPGVLRQIFFGSIEKVIDGLFFKTHSGQDIGYDRDEAHRAIVCLLEKFVKK